MADTARAHGGEEPPVAIENEMGAGRSVVVCEHASNRVPLRFANLGLDAAELERHIAWDPGAIGVARELARVLDAPCVSSTVSRLVIDCNRDPAMEDAIVAVGDGIVVPGNASVSEAERARRAQHVYAPFHAAVEAVLGRARRAGRVFLIGVHSFTPVFKGIERPWHVGILHDRDESMSAPMLAALRRDPALVVGENEPYSPSDRVYHTLDRHAQSVGEPSVMIEIRNDLLRTPAGQVAWGRRLGAIIAGL